METVGNQDQSQVEPTQVNQLSTPVAPPSQSKPKKNHFFVLTIVVLFFITLVFLFLQSKSKNLLTSKNEILPTPTAEVIKENPYLDIQKIEIKNVLVPYVSNFDNLSQSDLPNITDIRAVYSYNGHVILVGSPNIMEVDPNTNEIIRAADKRIFDCFYYSVKIGDALYLACNGTGGLKLQGIYKLDLKTGNIVKSYKPKPGVDFTNLNIALSGKTVWGGAQNGVIKIDTLTNDVSFYPSEKFSYSAHCPWYNIGANDVNVWMTPQASDCVGVSIYNNATDFWDNYPNNVFESVCQVKPITHYFTFAYSREKFYLAANGGIGDPGDCIFTYDQNTKTWIKVADPKKDQLKKPKDYRNKYFPNALLAQNNGSQDVEFNYYESGGEVNDYKWERTYFSIAGRRSNKYYILANDGVYTLEKNSFPKLITKVNIPVGGNTSFVDNKEEYALLIGPVFGMVVGDTFSDRMVSYLISLKTGELVDLLKTTGLSSSTNTSGLYKTLEKLPAAEQKEVANGVVYIDKVTKNEIVRVDFSSQKITFNY